MFVGEKPVAVHFDDANGKETVYAKSWKKVYAAIVKRCYSDPKCHETLMGLRGKIRGHSRVLLSDKPDGMIAPVKIAEDMYGETNSGVSDLIKTLVNRILLPAGFNINGIIIAMKMGESMPKDGRNSVMMNRNILSNALSAPYGSNVLDALHEFSESTALHTLYESDAGIALMLIEIEQAKQAIMNLVNVCFDKVVARLGIPDDLIARLSSAAVSDSMGMPDSTSIQGSTSTPRSANIGGYTVTAHENIAPLSANTALFNKRKPIAIILGKERRHVSSWRDIVITMLRRLCQDPDYADKLMKLRDSVTKENRKSILSDNPENFLRAAKIVDGLYVDVHHGATAMVKVFLSKVLDEIGYDYTDVYVVLKV